MNLTPNQMLGLGVLAVTAWWYFQNQTKKDESTTNRKKGDIASVVVKRPKKNAAFVARVEAVLHACRFADWPQQKQYLLSGEDPDSVVNQEMLRLGTKVKGPLGEENKNG